MKPKWGFSEKNIAYLFIFPAVLIITVIALYPVLRTFWLSLYDVRLNDPSKNDIYNSYKLDMDRFVEKYPILVSLIDRSSKKPENQPSVAKLHQLNEQVLEVKDSLSKVPNFAKQYDQVDTIQLDDGNVPEELATFAMNKGSADSLLKQLEALQSEVKKLKLKDSDKQGILGLLNGIEKTVITPNFVGFDHYTDIMKQSRFWFSLWNTTIFTVISVFIELVLGLAIALLINRQFRGRGIVRASVLVPWAIPTVVSALMWKFMFDGQNGIMAKFFHSIGLIPDMGTLLTSKFWSMFSVIFADVWKTTPFVTLLLLAGLQTISGSLYEAAHVDGATRMQQFFKITLPLLKPTILVTLLFRTLDAFKIFDLVYVLTGGSNSTETISLFTYKIMFSQMNFGVGSALSVIGFICIAIISIIYIRFLGANIMNNNQSH
ncbi:carbohydrate ABC transporter permease [Shimazuella kribbensis]|uniref:carbohydrate ABC transporter permease n=1 Tax=Shimazuella kribbensis TaxID=139808 RepID=UPI0004093BEC|nr:sugar ABC transporter permease [Shimazuella kribbensis]